MPLPLIPILIGAGAGAGALGIGKTVKAALDNDEANSYNKDANNTISKAKGRLKQARKASNSALEALGSKKLYMLDKNIARFVASFEKLKNVHLEDSTGLDELDKFRLDAQSVTELRVMSDNASSILSGAAAGAVGGALVAVGAFGVVAKFGVVATTGTAIASLSGAAATNATLAFLGGGALAVGGLGMAGGAMVLGGLVAGPALAIMGFFVGAKASENLDNAMSNYAEAEKIAEELETAVVFCDGIRKRSQMFERLLIRLDALFFPLVCGMEKIIAEKGDDWNAFSAEDKKTIAESASIAKAIKTVLDTPILTEEGKLTDESERIVIEVKAVLDSRSNV